MTFIYHRATAVNVCEIQTEKEIPTALSKS